METEVKFDKETDSLFALLDDSFYECKGQGIPFPLEGDREAKLEIIPEFPCLVICNLDNKIHIQSIPFCNQDKDEIKSCADHAVLLFNSESKTWSLHVFEFKTSIGGRTWNKVLEQFNGAVVRVYAVAGVLRIAEFHGGVYLHCVYRKNKSTPVEEKSHLGRPAPKDFLKAPITLSSYPELTSKNVPIQLDDAGHAEIRLDKRGYTMIPRRT